MAKNNDFFRDVGTAIFKPVGDFVGGAVTALQPGRTQQMKLQQEKMREFAESQRIQNLLRKAQADALGQGRTIYGGGGRSSDPYEKAGKLALAEQRLRDSEADEAADIVLGKINELTGAQGEIDKQEKQATIEAALADYFKGGLEELEDKEVGRASQEAVGKFTQGFAREAKKQGVSAEAAELLFGKLYKEERGKAGILRDDVLPRRDVIDPRGYFSYELDETVKPTATKAPSKKEVPTKPLEDYFQAETETVPEKNIPQTFAQLGITNADDMVTLEEMQDALPDRDLRQEYKDDPEGMQRLMKLWKEKKLSKKNIHKAFSMIQQKAKRSLGIA